MAHDVVLNATAPILNNDADMALRGSELLLSTSKHFAKKTEKLFKDRGHEAT